VTNLDTKATGEEKAKYAMLPSVKRCRVSFVDSDGVEHAVELDARTLYEAVGLAIDRFRRCEQVPYDPQGMHEFIVESREPSTQHRLPRNMFGAWLRRPALPARFPLRLRLWRFASIRQLWHVTFGLAFFW